MPALANPQHEAFARALAGGSKPFQAAIAAGYSAKSARKQAWRLAKKPKIAARVAELQQELAEATLVDAAELHRTWSEMLRADIADIVDPKTGCYKPLHRWPAIWRRMLSRLDVRELYERSKDGKEARWDKIGEIVRIRFVELTKLGDLLGRHKAVDAFVAQKIEATVDLHAKLEQVTARLQAGRERLAKAKK